MTTESPKVNVAINACAATVEMPKEVASAIFAAVSTCFARDKRRVLEIPAPFKTFAICCKELVIEIIVCSLA